MTSLPAPAFRAEDILDLYRLRWRVELAFKRLKSVIGLNDPPGKDPTTAQVSILAHLLMILLLEPLVDAFEDSPHWPSVHALRERWHVIRRNIYEPPRKKREYQRMFPIC